MNGILSGLSKVEFNEVILCKTTKEIWDMLESTYEGSDIEEMPNKENLKMDTAYEIRTKKSTQRGKILKGSKKT